KENKKSFAERTAEELTKSWDGTRSKVEVKTFNKVLGSGASSAGGLVEVQRNPGILMPGLRRLTIRDLLAQGRISSNALEYVRENVFTNGAAPVAEGALKPEANLTFTKETANVKTIAHWIQA
ncbi:phage major capsid protein, partial [Pseudomonas viridiflava]